MASGRTRRSSITTSSKRGHLSSGPKMITAGASAYPRVIDFARLRQIADASGAMLFVDMAHIAGLVARLSPSRPGARMRTL